MAPTAAPAAARITQRDTFHKVRCVQTDLYLRFHPRRRDRVRLTTAALCTWFTTRSQAEQHISLVLGPAAVEIERCDA